MRIAKMLALASASMAVFALASPALADTVTLSGDAVQQTNGVELTSDNSFSAIDIALSSSLTFSQLTTLSLNFNDIAGGDTQGSPRIAVGLFDPVSNTEKFMQILLGNAPNYNDNVATLNTWSNVNLIGNNDAGRYDDSQFADVGAGSSPFTTYASADALIGGLTMLDLIIPTDAGTDARAQDMLVGSLTYNTTTDDLSKTPLPAALPLFASGLGVLGFIARGKRRKEKQKLIG